MAKNLKIGDVVRFKKSDDWGKFLKGSFEVGFERGANSIKLQNKKTKERLPQTFLSKSLIVITRGDSYKRLKKMNKL